MKTQLLLMLTLLLIPTFINAQNVVITNIKMNVVFVGVDNPIKVAVADYSEKSIIVKVNQGIITGKNGNYIWRPTSPTSNGLVSVYIQQDNSEKLISTHIYRIKLIPNPYTSLSGWQRSCINPSGSSFIKNGLTAVLDNFPFDVQFEIISFKITVVRDNKVFFEGINNGGRFKGQTAQIIQMVEVGDKVYFSEVKCRYFGDGIVREINDLVFKIR